FSAFVVPPLTRTASALVADQGPLLTGGLGKFFMLTGTTFLLGYVLFGIATFRAGVFPRWAAALLAVSAPVLGLSPIMPAPVRLVGCIVFGAMNAVLGWMMWKGEAAR
ncbi:MAG TPA: hypothetical protein VGR07_14685, partial [Thermoanaerobaculia bacterium]|nr:hypothetical protein [Thermoanaerobaculia bacterium]